MNLTEFFRSAITSLPRGGFEASDETFDTFLTKLFRSYVSQIRELEDEENPRICSKVIESISEIECLSSNVAEAAKHYLEGHPHQAYQEIVSSLRIAEFGNMISEISSFDPAVTPVPFDQFLEATLHPTLYRMREDKALTASGQIDRKEIFHVPFEKRKLVQNQRYSIAGLPCLYFGSSLWICWEELGRPDLNATFLSRFRLTEAIKVLDLQLAPLRAWELYKDIRVGQLAQSPRVGELMKRYDDDFISSYVIYWPLIAACSIRVEDRNGSFFPQYIVPQLLLQWVTKEKEVNGIRYFSTRALESDWYANVNYVFPSREIKHSGRCRFLAERFRLMSPIPWEVLERLNLPNRHVMTGNERGVVKVADELWVHYYMTDFFQAESRLAQMVEEHPPREGMVED